MQNEIILYRGDHNKIPRFLTHVTSKLGLLGQGIYLTDDEDVADTYRHKKGRLAATPSVRKNTPQNRYKYAELAEYHAGYAPRDESEKKAFQHTFQTVFLKKYWNQKTNSAPLPAEHSKEWADHVKESKQVWRDKINKSEIVFNGLYVKESVPVGSVSVFKFPKADFENKVLDLSRPIVHKGFLFELYKQKKFFSLASDLPCFVKEGMQINSFKQYCVMMSRVFLGLGIDSELHLQYIDKYGKSVYHVEDDYMSRFTGKRRLSFNIQEIINTAKSIGFIGFEYSGGSFTKGLRHRAFNVWDHHYVNNHRVDIR